LRAEVEEALKQMEPPASVRKGLAGRNGESA
jgi:hypothetical protein